MTVTMPKAISITLNLFMVASGLYTKNWLLVAFGVLCLPLDAPESKRWLIEMLGFVFSSIFLAWGLVTPGWAGAVMVVCAVVAILFRALRLL